MERVLQICDWIGVRFSELVEIAARRRVEYHFCSPEQEVFLANHPEHFAFLRSIQKGESLSQLKRKYKVTDSDCRGYLADLEAHRFVAIVAGLQFKLLVADGMNWRPDGPLWHRFFSPWLREFTQHMELKDVNASEDCIIDISHRQLSKNAFKEMKREIDELSRKYASISRLERQIQPNDELEFYTCVLLCDEWTAPLWRVKPYKLT